MTADTLDKITSMIADKITVAQVAPRWLKLKEASRYSTIGRHRLKELAEAGDIKGFQDADSGRGDWVFDRYSLDEYREAQAGSLNKKAVEILRGVDA